MSDQSKSTEEDDIEDELTKSLKIETVDDYVKVQETRIKVQESKLRHHIFKKTFLLITFFIFVIISMGVWIFVVEKENRELITHGISNITQLITVIIQAVSG